MESNLTNIEEYYSEVLVDYPDISLSQVSEICRYPFKLVKSVMSSGDLRDIRLQYFGIFKVSESKIKYIMKTMEENFRLGKIPKERYDNRVKVLSSYEIS